MSQRSISCSRPHSLIRSDVLFSLVLSIDLLISHGPAVAAKRNLGFNSIPSAGGLPTKVQQVDDGRKSKSGSEMALLEVNKPIARELAGGQGHSYQINLAASQFLGVIVEQKGIDVVVTLFEPDGKKLIEVDSPNGTEGSELLQWVAMVAGNYRMQVRSLEKGVKAGRYEVKGAALREATAEDQMIVSLRQPPTDLTL